MELRHLRYFITVAEELHFGRAAERLHMTQPALSKQIRLLEEELEFQLLLRNKRHVQLTQAGRVFFEQAQQLLEQAEQALQLAKRTARGEVGQLAIGFTSSALHSVLPEIVPTFRDRYPNVELIVTELSTESQVEALHRDQIDIAFLHPPIKSKFLHIHLLLEEEFWIVLPKGHPLSSQKTIATADLANESFIIHPREEGPILYEQFLQHCEQAGFAPKIAQKVVANQTRVGLVAAGMGITFLPETLVNHLSNPNVICKPIKGTNPKMQLAAVWRQDNTSPTLRSFLEIMQEQKRVTYKC